jgi:hypothetical protein
VQVGDIIRQFKANRKHSIILDHEFDKFDHAAFNTRPCWRDCGLLIIWHGKCG